MLAVVGGVIGAIWVGAATVIENWKVNKTVEGIFSTARNIQNLISIRDAESLPTGYLTNETAITTAGINAGVFPKDWVVASQSVSSPFGANVTAVSAFDAENGGRFSIRLIGSGVSISVCAKLVVKASSIGKMAGGDGINHGFTVTGNNVGALLRIYVGADILYAFPVDLLNAEQKCTQNANSGGKVTPMYFVFGYTRIN